MSPAWIAGRVVGIDARFIDADKAFDLAAAFSGFQSLSQQINMEIFEWLDDPAEVSDAELLARTECICRQSTPRRRSGES